MSSIFDALAAFHINAFSHLVYAVKNSWWFVLLVAAAVVSIYLFLKEEAAVTVKDEQQVL